MRAGGNVFDERPQRHRFGAVERAPRLERGELHHAVDDFLDALGFAFDVLQETLALVVRHLRFLQQLGRAADRRERALHFVREGLHVVGHVVAPGERIAHFAEAGAHRIDRAPRHARQAQAALRAHPGPVVADQAEGPHQPDRDDHGEQQQRQRRTHADPDGAHARVLDELAEALHRLADADDADDLVVPADRRADVHHRSARVAVDVARGARAVQAAERALHVAPLRVVVAQVAAERIEHHAAGAVGDVHAQLDPALVQVVDLGRELARVDAAKQRLQPRRVDGAGDHVLLDQAGHELRGFDQRFLGRLAVARVDVGNDAVQQEGDARRVDQQDADEDPGPARHSLLAGRSSCSA
ncbi:hypothetical protein D3C87_1081520 [compost metagenome]